MYVSLRVIFVLIITKKSIAGVALAILTSSNFAMPAAMTGYECFVEKLVRYGCNFEM